MVEIIWTDPALGDLEDIVEYISQDSFMYASRVAAKVVDAVDRLHQFPRIGRMVSEVERDDIREVIVGNYRNSVFSCR